MTANPDYSTRAQQQTAHVPDLPAGLALLPVTSIGVIGAGTMGGGIAMNFLNAGLPVTLVETSQAALDRGLATIRRNYENSARKGRLPTDEVETRMALISPGLDLQALATVDLVIEAVFEDLGIKKELFGKLDTIARPGAILASNTSYLDLDAIAAATSRPHDVAGLHFFSPANVMRLLEIVRGKATRPEVLATLIDLAPRIGKVPVVSRVCHGFIANRVMSVRRTHAERLVLEGPSPAEIDAALRDYGFAMGQFQVMDLVGLDVLGRGSTERTLRGDLVALGRLGQKQGGGFYDYDDQRRATPSPVAEQVISRFAADTGVVRSGPMPPERIVARLLYPVVNECARVVEEGVAVRASDVDVACVLGYNWPASTGGPLHWADSIGLGNVVEALVAMGEEPADLLRRAAAGERLTPV